MLNYAHLEALLAVEREKSFEGAARAMGVTSSAISQRIKLLEECIGAVALKRQVPVTPTEIGATLCRHAEMVLMLENDVVQQHRIDVSAKHSTSSHLKIVVNDDSLSSWFKDVLAANSLLKNPYVFDITVADKDCSIEKMKSGAALAAVTTERVPFQGFTSTYLGNQTYRAVASPTFIKENFKDGVSIDALNRVPALRFNALDNLQVEWIEKVFDVSPKLNYHSIPSSRGFLSALLADVSWGVHNAEFVDEHLQSGALVELVDHTHLKRALYWHCSRMIAEPFKQITKNVISAGNRHLDQTVFDKTKAA